MRHILLVVACAALLVGLHFSSTAGAQPAPAVQRERWEYATLSFTTEWQFAWMIGGKRADGDIASTLKAIGSSSVPEKPTLADVLNQAGVDGWELVMVDNHPKTFAASYYFKRRLP